MTSNRNKPTRRQKFQSTSPYVGDDMRCAARGVLLCDFNPHPPYVGDDSDIASSLASPIFQSTSPPHGGRQQNRTIFQVIATRFALLFTNRIIKSDFILSLYLIFLCFFGCEPMLIFQAASASHRYRIRLPSGSYDSLFPYCSIFEEYFFPRL